MPDVKKSSIAQENVKKRIGRITKQSVTFKKAFKYSAVFKQEKVSKISKGLLIAVTVSKTKKFFNSAWLLL